MNVLVYIFIGRQGKVDLYESEGSFVYNIVCFQTSQDYKVRPCLKKKSKKCPTANILNSERLASSSLRSRSRT